MNILFYYMTAFLSWLYLDNFKSISYRPTVFIIIPLFILDYQSKE